MINITFTTGDIFTSNADILVNPINTSVISGKGLAKEFARELGYSTIEEFINTNDD